MQLKLSLEEFVYFQVKNYSERLAEERQKPDSDRKTKAIAFLRDQLHRIQSSITNSPLN